MSNCDDVQKLAEDVNEFDRLMSTHDDDHQSTDDIGDLVVTEDVTFIVGAGKPDVGAIGVDHGGIELVQLPATSVNEKTEIVEVAVVGRVMSFAGRVYSVIKSDLGLLVILLAYSVLGAVVLSRVEHGRQLQMKQQLNEHKHRCIDAIVNASLMASNRKRAQSSVIDDDDDLYQNLSQTVETLLDVFVEHKEQLGPNSKAPEWTFWGALFFCGTVYTTVGYGYIYPVTTTGRVITMIYAAFGIPLCLVVLASVGKSLTRAIKFLWSFIRRFYYTGSFRVRSVIPLSRVRLSMFQRLINRLRRRKLTRRRQETIRTLHAKPDVGVGVGVGGGDDGVEEKIVAAVDAELQCLRELDETFVPYEVDDRFDLPPIIALAVAFLYTLLGAFIYTRWEDWGYFEAFYFTFISLATIGFGDVIPNHTKNFMATSVYLLFGLALIAMVVNVVMETVGSTIDKAKDGVYDVGRKIVDVAADVVQRQTILSLEHEVTPAAHPAAGRQSTWVSATVSTWPKNRRRSV